VNLPSLPSRALTHTARVAGLACALAHPLWLGAQGVEGWVLRHRVVLEAVAAEPVPGTTSVDLTIASGSGSSSGPRRDSPSTALPRDLASMALSRSPHFRLVEPTSTTGTAAADAIVILRHSEPNQTPVRVWLRLLDPSSRAVSALAEGDAPSLEGAIEVAVAELGRQVIRRAYHLQVAESRQGLMLVRRGRADGLEQGMRFRGFRSAGTPAASAEEAILWAGEPAGQYELVTVQEGAATVRPLAGAPALEPGDWLELPAIVLPPADRPSRERSVIDSLYPVPIS